MPQEAEDLAEDIIFQYLDAADAIAEVQREVLGRLAYYRGGSRSRLIAPQNAVARQIYALERQSDEYFNVVFPRVYLAGVRSAVGNNAYTLTAADNAIINEIRDHAQSQLAKAHYLTITDSRRFMNMLRSPLDRYARERPSMPVKHLGRNIPFYLDYIQAVGPQAQALGGRPYADILLEQQGMRSFRFSDGKHYKLDDYAGMLLRSSANRAYNLAVVQAGRKQKIGWFEVQDGPECGWDGHHDSDKANGTIRSADECASQPLSHPNCRRVFLPRPDLTERPKRPARRAAEVAVAAGAATAVAAGAVALARSQAADMLLNRIAMAALEGDPLARMANAYIQPIRHFFGVMDQNAKILAMQFPEMPPYLPNIIDELKVAGSEFLTRGVDALSPRVRYALGLTDDSGAVAGDKLQMIYRYLHNQEVGKQSAEQMAKILQFEAKRRKLTDIAFLKDSRLASDVQVFWNRFGTRYRIDMSDYLRFKGYVGKAKSVTVNAAGKLRGQLKMFGDGTIGGHLSLVPKGIFRAIIEVDENGKLVGNVRLVPGGPLKVKLEFETPRPLGWKQMGLVAGRDFVDFRTIDMDSLRWSNLAGTFKEVAQNLRKMELKRVVLDFNVFRRTPFEIAYQLRIPIEDVKAAISGAHNLIVGEAGEITGNIAILVRNGKTFLEDMFRDTTGTLYGTINFEQMKTATRVRLHTENIHLQDIAANMRFGGYNAFEIANMMEARWSDVQILLKAAQDRMRLFLDDLGVMGAPDISPLWEGRLADTMSTFQRTGNAADVVRDSLRTLTGQISRPSDERFLEVLANLADADRISTIERKLRSFRDFVRAYYVESDEIQSLAGRIDNEAIRLYAAERYSRFKGLPKVSGLADIIDDIAAPPASVPIQADEIVDSAIRRMRKHFPEMSPVSIRYAKTRVEGRFAEYLWEENTVVLDIGRWSNLDFMRTRLRTLKQFRFHAGDGTPRSVVEHELAHHILDHLSRAQEEALWDRIDEYLPAVDLMAPPGVDEGKTSRVISRELGSYANFSWAELTAEALTAYVDHGRGYSGLADLVYDFVRGALSGQIQRTKFVVDAKGVVTEVK